MRTLKGHAKPSQLSSESTPVVVELRDVSREFRGPSPVYALKNVNLTVEKGEYLSVMGPSGSGKSTLLNILGVLDRPTSGTYLLDGRNTASASEKQRALLRGGKIGFVFQAFHLLPHRTVLDNVLLGTLYSRVPRDEREDRAIEALERVGLAHRSQFTPLTLSGGEKQRAAIARSLIATPSLLLADEPTGNLDSRNSEDILDLFHELHSQGLTVIVITHDPLVAARSTRAIRIEDGHLKDSS